MAFSSTKPLLDLNESIITPFPSITPSAEAIYHDEFPWFDLNVDYLHEYSVEDAADPVQENVQDEVNHLQEDVEDVEHPPVDLNADPSHALSSGNKIIVFLRICS